jgi:hypothetical protein
MPWDVFASHLSRNLRITHVARVLAGIVIAAELTALTIRGDSSDKRRVMAEGIEAFWKADPGTFQLLLLTALALVAANLIGLAAQSLLFFISYNLSSRRKQERPIGMVTPTAPRYGREVAAVLCERYRTETVKALIAKHPIAVDIEDPDTLYKASEYSSFWLQRNVPEFQQSGLTNYAFILYTTVTPILLAPFAINALQYEVGIISYRYTAVNIAIAAVVSGWILLTANRTISRVPTLLVQLFVAYALVADHSPAQPPAKDQEIKEVSRAEITS